jgi:hypothetical protein
MLAVCDSARGRGAVADTKAIGEVSEAMVAAALLRTGHAILKPFGDNQRYDLVIESAGKFDRVQCKTGRLKNGVIKFKTCSNRNVAGSRGVISRHYVGGADLFGVYCPETGQCYLVPVSDCGVTNSCLRIAPPRNKQASKIRLASEFAIGG